MAFSFFHLVFFFCLAVWRFFSESSVNCTKYLLQHVHFVRRLGEPEDCAGAASFLASDESRFITGETLVVAGGAPSRL